MYGPPPTSPPLLSNGLCSPRIFSTAAETSVLAPQSTPPPRKSSIESNFREGTIGPRDQTRCPLFRISPFGPATTGSDSVLRISVFGFLSAFVIRHSDFPSPLRNTKILRERSRIRIPPSSPLLPPLGQLVLARR